MATPNSILNDTKKILGLDADNDAFDLDILTHINTCFFTLYQLGIGPPDGFEIEDDGALWDDFTGGSLKLNPIRTYIYLRVRLLFDPPSLVPHINAMQEQVTELEHRLQVERELTEWTPPAPSSSPSLP